MDLRYSESEQRLQRALRAWLAAVLPSWPPSPGRSDWPAQRAYDLAWQQKLFEAGYAGISWPKRFGGRDASPTEQLVFLEEMARAGAPDIGVNFVGQLHAGPTLMVEGTEEQQNRHLPAILRGEEVWCQGFSEPSAGSDLASLRTRAVRDGDDYVVTGQKIWSSYAHVADYCELLVRTDLDAPKHRGITWLILPMDTPGLEVRPLTTVLGTTEFCEVFLDEVRVPVENAVGPENDGWRVAMVTFSFERGTSLVHELRGSIRLAADIKATAQATGLWDHDKVRAELGQVAAGLDALWALTVRNVSQAARSGAPGIGGSVFKLRYGELTQQLTDLARRVLGRAALARDDVDGLPSAHYIHERLRMLSIPIAAGTSQVQRNILAERVLGLPKEPRWTSS